MKTFLFSWSCFFWLVLPILGTQDCLRLGAQEQNQNLDLTARFLQEAPSRWKEYRERAKRLQGSHSLSLVQTLEQTTVRIRSEERRNDTCILLHFSFERSTNNKKEDPTLKVFGVNPNYSFTLQRATPSAPWSVTEIERRKNPLAPAKLPAGFDGVISHFYLIKLHTEFLSEMVARPEFKVVGCRWVPHGNEKRVEVIFDYGHEAKKPSDNRVQGGKLLVDPQRFWSVSSYEVQTKTTTSQGLMKMEILGLDETQESLPVPTKAVMRNQVTFDGIYNEQEWKFEWNLRVPRQLPGDEEFSLQAFGLPEPGQFGWKKSASNYYLAFVAIGICGLVLGMYFWRRFKRLESAHQAGREIVPPRPGFTLIELLVVIAIIGVLIALIIPAVQKVRGAALRTECLNNLKQIGLAAHQFHDTARVFPAGMRGPEAMRFSSWLAAILPYIEQGALWRTTQEAYQQSPSPFQNPPHVGLATVVRTYSCPADGRAEQPVTATIDKFSVALTNYLGVSGKDLTTLDGILFRDSHIRVADISDGTSQTLFAGERPPSANLQFGWWYAGVGQKFTGSADSILGVEEQNVLPIVKGGCGPGTYTFAPGSINDQCDMFHFWSPHSGGANFLFADGSVRLLRYDAAPIMPALASRAGNDVVSGLDF